MVIVSPQFPGVVDPWLINGDNYTKWDDPPSRVWLKEVNNYPPKTSMSLPKRCKREGDFPFAKVRFLPFAKGGYHKSAMISS